MPRAFTHLTLDDVGIGGMSPHAVISLDPAQLTTKLGCVFSEGVDGLDSYEAAAVAVAGESAVLIRHRGLPSGLTQLYLADKPNGGGPVWKSIGDSRRRADAVLGTLGIPRARVTWRRGDPLAA